MNWNIHGPSAKASSAIVSAILLVVCAATSARAAKGDCGQPQSTGTKPSAGDALAILKEAVGQATSCDAEPCICDVSGNGAVQASDALITLKIAVGQNQPLNCDCEVTVSTSTSTSTSTSSTMPISSALTWTTIQSVFATSCAGSGCHDTAGNPDGNGGGNLKGIENKATAYAEMTTENITCTPSALAGKKRVVPGDPEQSLLMKKLDGTHDCGERMPLVGPILAEGFRDGVRLWIMEGAPNN